MRILFTGGGTLGPVTPLLAVAEELNAKCKMQNVKCELVWIGTRRGPERKLVQEAGIPFLWIWAPKWRRYFDVRNIVVPVLLGYSVIRSLGLLLWRRPRAVVSAGGFVGVPIIWAAWTLRIPAFLHNQDVRWSLANRLVAPFVARITYALPGTVPARWKKKAVWTGNPVRSFILSRSRHPERSPKGEVEGSRTNVRGTILVIGGGTGAKRLNEIVAEALPELTKSYRVIHLTGHGKDIQYPISNIKYHTIEFVTSEIVDLYAVADLVITRAGMGVLSELAALSKPMIIVPIPGSHQEENARYFEKRGAAVVLNQNTLAGAKLVDAVRGLFSDKTRMHSLAVHAKDLMKPDAAKRVAQEIIAIVK